MANPKIEEYAAALFQAEADRVAIEPLTEQDASLTIDDAYAIQLANVARVVEMGHVISGKKIGLTSFGMQNQFGVNEPDYGHLFQSMECRDGVCQSDQLIQPKVEAEIAFVMKEALPAGEVTVEDIKRATDYVVAAFEIVDSRLADWRIKLVDTVSDNASSGRYVLGERHVSVADVDLPTVHMKLFKNGELHSEGDGSAVLGDPCIAVAWLANKLRGYGVEFEPGDVILSGALQAAPAVVKGDVWEADFGALGTVKCAFV